MNGQLCNKAIAITRQNPRADITSEEWVDYVRRNPKLLLVQEKPMAMAVHIEEKRNKYIFATNGVISCDGLSVPIMREMFECSRFLNADVVGPKGYVFKSFEEWHKKTIEKRRQYSERLESSKKERNMRMFRFLFFVGVFLVVLCVIWS
ncbi:MAG: hypothetical protein JJT96_09395 [Opitutales bacterium]|nr:hypothetical protein [Opitutales bacterium]